MSASQEQYIEHEVQLRLHDERFKLFDGKIDERFKLFDEKIDEKFKIYDHKYVSRFNHLEKRLDNVDGKLNWIIGIVVGSVLLPVALHFLKLI